MKNSLSKRDIPNVEKIIEVVDSVLAHQAEEKVLSPHTATRDPTSSSSLSSWEKALVKRRRLWSSFCALWWRMNALQKWHLFSYIAEDPLEKLQQLFLYLVDSLQEFLLYPHLFLPLPSGAPAVLGTASPLLKSAKLDVLSQLHGDGLLPLQHRWCQRSLCSTMLCSERDGSALFHHNCTYLVKKRHLHWMTDLYVSFCDDVHGRCQQRSLYLPPFPSSTVGLGGRPASRSEWQGNTTSTTDGSTSPPPSSATTSSAEAAPLDRKMHAAMSWTARHAIQRRRARHHPTPYALFGSFSSLLAPAAMQERDTQNGKKAPHGVRSSTAETATVEMPHHSAQESRGTDPCVSSLSSFFSSSSPPPTGMVILTSHAEALQSLLYTLLACCDHPGCSHELLYSEPNPCVVSLLYGIRHRLSAGVSLSLFETEEIVRMMEEEGPHDEEKEELPNQDPNENGAVRKEQESKTERHDTWGPAPLTPSTPPPFPSTVWSTRAEEGVEVESTASTTWSWSHDGTASTPPPPLRASITADRHPALPRVGKSPPREKGESGGGAWRANTDAPMVFPLASIPFKKRQPPSRYFHTWSGEEGKVDTLSPSSSCAAPLSSISRRGGVAPTLASHATERTKGGEVGAVSSSLSSVSWFELLFAMLQRCRESVYSHLVCLALDVVVEAVTTQQKYDHWAVLPTISSFALLCAKFLSECPLSFSSSAEDVVSRPSEIAIKKAATTTVPAAPEEEEKKKRERGGSRRRASKERMGPVVSSPPPLVSASLFPLRLLAPIIPTRRGEREGGETLLLPSPDGPPSSSLSGEEEERMWCEAVIACDHAVSMYESMSLLIQVITAIASGIRPWSPSPSTTVDPPSSSSHLHTRADVFSTSKKDAKERQAEKGSQPSTARSGEEGKWASDRRPLGKGDDAVGERPSFPTPHTWRTPRASPPPSPLGHRIPRGASPIRAEAGVASKGDAGPHPRPSAAPPPASTTRSTLWWKRKASRHVDSRSHPHVVPRCSPPPLSTVADGRGGGASSARPSSTSVVHPSRCGQEEDEELPRHSSHALSSSRAPVHAEELETSLYALQHAREQFFLSLLRSNLLQHLDVLLRTRHPLFAVDMQRRVLRALRECCRLDDPSPGGLRGGRSPARRVGAEINPTRGPGLVMDGEVQGGYGAGGGRPVVTSRGSSPHVGKSGGGSGVPLPSLLSQDLPVPSPSMSHGGARTGVDGPSSAFPPSGSSSASSFTTTTTTGMGIPWVSSMAYESIMPMDYREGMRGMTPPSATPTPFSYPISPSVLPLFGRSGGGGSTCTSMASSVESSGGGLGGAALVRPMRATTTTLRETDEEEGISGEHRNGNKKKSGTSRGGAQHGAPSVVPPSSALPRWGSSESLLWGSSFTATTLPPMLPPPPPPSGEWSPTSLLVQAPEVVTPGWRQVPAYVQLVDHVVTYMLNAATTPMGDSFLLANEEEQEGGGEGCGSIRSPLSPSSASSSSSFPTTLQRSPIRLERHAGSQDDEACPKKDDQDQRGTAVGSTHRDPIPLPTPPVTSSEEEPARKSGMERAGLVVLPSAPTSSTFAVPPLWGWSSSTVEFARRLHILWEAAEVVLLDPTSFHLFHGSVVLEQCLTLLLEGFQGAYGKEEEERWNRNSKSRRSKKRRRHKERERQRNQDKMDVIMRQKNMATDRIEEEPVSPVVRSSLPASPLLSSHTRKRPPPHLPSPPSSPRMATSRFTEEVKVFLPAWCLLCCRGIERAFLEYCIPLSSTHVALIAEILLFLLPSSTTAAAGSTSFTGLPLPRHPFAPPSAWPSISCGFSVISSVGGGCAWREWVFTRWLYLWNASLSYGMEKDRKGTRSIDIFFTLLERFQSAHQMPQDAPGFLDSIKARAQGILPTPPPQPQPPPSPLSSSLSSGSPVPPTAGRAGTAVPSTSPMGGPHSLISSTRLKEAGSSVSGSGGEERFPLSSGGTRTGGVGHGAITRRNSMAAHPYVQGGGGGGGGVVDPVALNTNAVDCVHASELTNIILKSIFTSLLERNPLLFTEPLAELLLKLMREPDPNLSRLGRWCIHASLEWRESHGAYAKALRHCYAHDILGLASVVGDVTTAPKRGSPTIITTTSSSSGRETSSGVDDTSIPSSVPVPGTKAIADDTLGERSIAEKKKRTAAQEAWTTIVLLLHILSRHLNPDTVGSSDVLFERRLWLHEEGVVMAVVELLAGLLEEEKQPIFSAIAGAAATATTTGTSTATMGGGGTPLGSMEKWRQMIPVIFRFLTTFEPPHPISPQLADTPFVSLLHARLSRLHGGVVEHWYWIIFCLLAALGKFPRIPVSTIMERGGGGDATRKPSGNTSGAYERTARRPLSTSTSPAGGSTAVSSASSSSPAVSRKSDTSEQSPEERPLLQGKEQEETASITPWRQAEMGCSSFMWVRDLEPFLSLLEHYNGVADRPIFLDLIPASALYLKEHGPPLYHHLVEKILPQLFQATGASVFTSSSIIQFVLSQSLTSLYPSLSLSHETIQSLPFHGSPAALEAFWLPMLERAPLRSALRFVEHGGMMITLGALPPRGLSFSAVLRFDDLYPVMTLCELQAVGWRSSRVRLVVLDGDTMQLVQETPDGSSLSKPTATHPSTSSSGGAGSTLSTSPPSPPPPPPSGRAAAVATSTRTSEATTAVKSSGKEGGSGGTVPTTSSTLPTPTRVTLNEKHGLLHFLPRCWMYLTVVFTIARTITVYLNGVKVGSGSVPLFVPSAGMILRLGLLDNPPFPQATFALSEVTVWAEELTWRQVEAAMAGIDPSAAQSTKLHYREVAYLGDSLPGFLSGEGGGGAAGRGGGRGRGQGIGCGGKVYDANPSMVANPIDDRIAHFVAHETESELFINLSASPPASTSHCDSMNSSGNAGSSIPQTSSSSIPVTSRGEEGTPFRPPIVAKMVGRYTTPPKRWVDYHLLWSSHGGLFRLLEWLPHVRDSDHLLRLLSVFATAVRHVTNFYTMDARLYVLLAQQLSLFCGRYITTEVADKLLFAAATRPTDVDGFRMSSILVNRLVLLYVLCDAGVYREMPLHVALYMFQQMQRSFFDPQQCAFAARNIHFADPVVLTDSMLQAAVQLAVQHAPIRLVYAAMQCAKQILLVCPEHVGVMDAFTSLSAALTPVEKRVQLPFLFPAEKPPALSPTPLRPSAVLNNANGKSETVEVKKTDDTTDRNEEGKEGEGEGYNTPSSPLSSPSVKEDLPRPSSSCASSPSSTVAMPPFWLTLRLPCCSTAISPHAVPHLPLRLQRHLSYLLLATLLECRNSPISRPFHLSLSRCVSLSWYITCLSSFTLPASVLAATRLFLDVARQSPSLQQELEFHQSTVVQALRPHAWCEDLPLLLLAMAIGAHDRIELLSSRCPLLEQLEIHHMHWNTSPPGSSVAGGGMSLGVIIASLCLDVLVLFLQSIMDEAHQLPNLGRHAFLCAAHQRLQEQGKRGDVGSGGGSNYPLHYSSTTIKMMMAAASSFSSPSTTPRRLPPHRVFSVGEDTRLPPSATATPTKALTAVSYYMQLPWVSYRFRRVISVVRSSARLMMSVNRRRYIRGRGGRVGYTSGPSLALPLLLPLPSPASPRPAQREKEGDANATTSASYPASSSRSPSVFASTPSPSIAWQRKVKSCPRGKPGEDSLVWWQATFEKKREPPQDDAGVLGPEGTASTLTSEVSLSSLVHSEPNEKDGETKVERRATKEEKVEEGVPSITASASSLVASMRHRSSVAVLHTVTILWLSILKKRYAPLYVSPGTFDARPLFSATSPSAARQPNPGRPPREEGWNTHPIAPSYEDRLPPGEGVEEEGNLTVASHSFSSLLPVSSLSASVKSQHSKKEQGTSMLLDPPSTAAPPVKPADGAAKAAKGSLPFLSYPVVGEEWGKTLDRLLSLPSSSASPTQHPEELAEKQLVYRVLRCFHGITSQPRYYALFVSSPFQSVAWGSLFRFVSISRMHSMVRAFDQRMLQYVYPREERKRNVSSLPSVKEKKREPQGKRNHSLSSSGPATSQSGRSDPDMSRESSPAHVPSLGTALSTKEENPVVETTSVLEGSTTHTASSPIERDISSPHARSSPPLPLPPPSMAMSTPASRCGSPTSGGDGRDDALLPISSHLSFHMMGMEDREGLTSLGSSPPPPPQTLLGTPGSSVGSGHGGSALPRPTSSSPTPSPVTTVWPTTAESEVLPTALGSALQDAVLLPTSGSFSSSSSASSPSPPYTCAKESQRAMTESLSLCMPVSERRRDDSNRETMSLLPPPLLLPQKEELEERGREASEIVQGGSPLPPGIFSSSRASTPVSRGNGGSPSPSPSPLRGLPTASSSTTKEDAGETEATRVVSCASTVTALPTTLPTDVDDDRARTPHPDPGEASDAASQTHAAEEKKIQHGRTSLADTSLSSLFPSASSSLPQIPLFVGQGTTSSLAPSTAVAANAETSPKRGTVAEKEEDMEADAVLDPISKTWRAIRMAMGERTRREAFHMLDTLIEVSLYASPPMWSTSTQYYDQQQQHHHRPPSHKKDVSTGGGGGEERYSGMLYPSTMASSTSSAAAAGASAAFSAGGFASRKEMGGGEKGTSASGGGGAAGTTGGAGISSEWVGGVPYGACGGLLFHLLFITSSTASNPCTAGHLITYFLFKVASFVQQVFPPPFLETATPENPVGPLSRTAGTHREEERLSSYYAASEDLDRSKSTESSPSSSPTQIDPRSSREEPSSWRTSLPTSTFHSAKRGSEPGEKVDNRGRSRGRRSSSRSCFPGCTRDLSPTTRERYAASTTSNIREARRYASTCLHNIVGLTQLLSAMIAVNAVTLTQVRAFFIALLTSAQSWSEESSVLAVQRCVLMACATTLQKPSLVGLPDGMERLHTICLLFQLALTPNSGRNGMIESLFYGLYTTLHKTPAPTWLSPASVTHRHRVLVRMMRIVLTVYVVGTRPGYPLPSALWKHVSPVYAVGAIPPSDTGRQSYGGRPSGFLAASTDTTMSPTTATGRLSGGVVNTLAGLARFPMTPSTASATGEKPVLVKHPLLELMVSQWLLGGGFRTAVTPVTWTAAKAQEEDEGEEGKQEEVEKAEEGSPCPSFSTSHAPFHASGADHRHSHTTNETTSTSTVEEEMNEEDLLYIQLCQVLQEHNQALENFASGKTKNLLELCNKEERATRAVYVEKLRVCSQQYSIVLAKSTSTSSTSSSSFPQQSSSRGGGASTTSSSSVASVPPSTFSSGAISLPLVEEISMHYLQRFGSYIDTDLPFFYPSEEPLRERGGGGGGERGTFSSPEGKGSMWIPKEETEGGQWLTLHCAAAGDAMGSQYTEEVYHSLDPYSGYTPIRTSRMDLLCGKVPPRTANESVPNTSFPFTMANSDTFTGSSPATSPSSHSRGKSVRRPPASSELLRMFLHDPHMSHVAVLIRKFITRCRPYLTDTSATPGLASSSANPIVGGSTLANVNVSAVASSPEGGLMRFASTPSFSTSNNSTSTMLSPHCRYAGPHSLPLPSFIHPTVSFLTPSAWTLIRYLLHPRDQLRYIANGFHICGLSATPCLLLLTNVRLVLLPFSRLTQKGDVILCEHDNEDEGSTGQGDGFLPSSSSSCSPAACGGEGKMKRKHAMLLWSHAKGRSGGTGVYPSSSFPSGTACTTTTSQPTPAVTSNQKGSGGFSLGAVTRHLHRFLTEEVRGGGFGGGGGGGGGSGKDRRAREQQEKEEHRMHRDGTKVAQAMRQITRHSYRRFYWSYLLSSLRRVHCLRYMHLETAVHLELHLGDGPMLALMDPHESLNPNARTAFITALKEVLADPLCFANPMDVEFNEASSRSAQLRFMLMRWATGALSNYDYLSFLNICACRTLKECSQYPVFPWVIADYTSSLLRLDQESTYRQLSYPIGAQTEARRSQLREHYEQSKELAMDTMALAKSIEGPGGTGGSPSGGSGMMEAYDEGHKGNASPYAARRRAGGEGGKEDGAAGSAGDPTNSTGTSSSSSSTGAVVPRPPAVHPFHHGVHYSTSGGVLYYLLRCEPFTTYARQYHGGHFDHPNRLFLSIAEAYHSCVTVSTDNKELLPMFYDTMGDFLYNKDKLDLGTREGRKEGEAGRRVDHVELPPWAKGSVQVFTAIMRYALESDYVRLHLHEWVDLVFGTRRRGPLAVERCNVFQRMTYGEEVLEALRHANSRQECDLIIAEVDCFGQAPRQLFTERHPSYLELAPRSTSEDMRHYLSSNTSFFSSALGSSTPGTGSTGAGSVGGDSGSNSGGGGTSISTHASAGTTTHNSGASGARGGSTSGSGGGSGGTGGGSNTGMKLTYQQVFERESPRVLAMIIHSLGDHPSPYSIMVELIDEKKRKRWNPVDPPVVSSAAALSFSVMPPSTQAQLQSLGILNMDAFPVSIASGVEGAWEPGMTSSSTSGGNTTTTTIRTSQAGDGNSSMLSIRPSSWPTAWTCGEVSFLRHPPSVLKSCFSTPSYHGRAYASSAILGFSLFRSCGRKESDCCYPSHPFSSAPPGTSVGYSEGEKGSGMAMGTPSPSTSGNTGGGGKKSSSRHPSSSTSSVSPGATGHLNAMGSSCSGGGSHTATVSGTSSASHHTTTASTSGDGGSGGGRFVSPSNPLPTSASTTPSLGYAHYPISTNTNASGGGGGSSGGAAAGLPPPLCFTPPPIGFCVHASVVVFPSLPGCTAVEGTDYYLCWHPLESCLMRFRQDDGSFISMLPFDLPNESSVRLTVVKAGYREGVIVIGTSAGNLYALFPDVHGRGPYLHSVVMRVHHSPLVDMDLDTVHGKLLTITGNPKDEPVLWRISHCHLSMLVRLPVRQVLQRLRRASQRTRSKEGERCHQSLPTALHGCPGEVVNATKKQEASTASSPPLPVVDEGAEVVETHAGESTHEKDREKRMMGEGDERKGDEEEEEEDAVIRYGCLEKRHGLVILLTRRYILYFDHAGRPYGCGGIPMSPPSVAPSGPSPMDNHALPSSSDAPLPVEGESGGERKRSATEAPPPVRSTTNTKHTKPTLVSSSSASMWATSELAPMNVLAPYDTTEWARGIQLLVVGHVDGTLSLWRVTRSPPAAVNEGEIVLIQFHTTIKERPTPGRGVSPPTGKTNVSTPPSSTLPLKQASGIEKSASVEGSTALPRGSSPSPLTGRTSDAPLCSLSESLSSGLRATITEEVVVAELAGTAAERKGTAGKKEDDSQENGNQANREELLEGARSRSCRRKDPGSSMQVPQQELTSTQEVGLYAAAPRRFYAASPPPPPTSSQGASSLSQRDAKKPREGNTLAECSNAARKGPVAVTAIHQLQENVPHFLIGYENGTIRSWRFCVLDFPSTAGTS